MEINEMLTQLQQEQQEVFAAIKSFEHEAKAATGTPARRERGAGDQMIEELLTAHKGTMFGLTEIASRAGLPTSSAQTCLARLVESTDSRVRRDPQSGKYYVPAKSAVPDDDIPF